MRIDFNQKGSWRKGVDFGDVNEGYVMDLAAQLALCADAKLRIVAGDMITWYWDPYKEWHRPQKGGRR